MRLKKQINDVRHVKELQLQKERGQRKLMSQGFVNDDRADRMRLAGIQDCKYSLPLPMQLQKMKKIYTDKIVIISTVPI